MTRRLLNRKIVTNQLAGQAVAGTLVLGANLVMILGIRRLSLMELTEAQVFFGAIAVMALAGICLALALLIRLTMRPNPSAPG